MAVKSALRVIEIMEFFARHRRPARLSELAEALGYPVSSTDALLKTLTAQGYMRLDADTRGYWPSSRMAHLTSWIKADGFEQVVALDAMFRLRAAVDEPVVLATPNGIYLDYVESILVAGRQTLHLRAGERRLLVQTGTGWLFLARQQRSEALEIYRQTIDLRMLHEKDFGRADFERRLDEHMAMDVSVLWASELSAPTAHWNGGMISAIIATPPESRPLALGVYGSVQSLAAKRDFIVAEMRAEVDAIRSQVDAGTWSDHPVEGD
nr:helix-turn-helix domain-containing protein [Sphingomonas sp. CDS-1]